MDDEEENPTCNATEETPIDMFAHASEWDQVDDGPKEDDSQHQEAAMPTTNVGNPQGRTFITDPDEQGEQLRARIDSVNETAKETADGKEKLWEF